ncbi:MAG TPA: hypothetical protein VF157_16270 [Chloroflexota bacterium]
MKAVARVFAIILVAVMAFTACGRASDVNQIKAVIEKSNHEQEDAFAAHDPSLMQDTHTARDFAYMVRTNEVLEQEGAVGIRLMQIEWGKVDVQSDTAAQAETFETWEETDQDGNTVSTRDRNIYRLLKIGGQWKIDEVIYPDKQETPTEDTGSPAPARS